MLGVHCFVEAGEGVQQPRAVESLGRSGFTLLLLLLLLLLHPADDDSHQCILSTHLHNQLALSDTWCYVNIKFGFLLGP